MAGLPTVRGCLRVGLDPPVATGAITARLIAIEDFAASHQERNKTVAAAVRSYLENAPEALTTVVLLGDNFYLKELVGVEGNCEPSEAAAKAIAQQLEAVLEPYGFLRQRRTPVKAVAGNHDHGCGVWGLENQKNLDRFLTLDRHWGDLWDFHFGAPRAVQLPGGELQLVLIDSEAMLQNFQTLESSLQTMEQLLASGTGSASWQVVVAHHPLRTVGTHDGAFPDGLRKPLSFVLFPVHFLAAARVWPFSGLSEEACSFQYQRYRRGLERAFRRHPGAFAVFSARHDHSLQLLEPAEAGMPVDVVIGSGAYCLPARKDQAAEFAAAKHGFGVLAYTREKLDIQLYGTNACAEERVCAMGTATAALLCRHTLVHRGLATPTEPRE